MGPKRDQEVDSSSYPLPKFPDLHESRGSSGRDWVGPDPRTTPSSAAPGFGEIGFGETGFGEVGFGEIRSAIGNNCIPSELGELLCRSNTYSWRLSRCSCYIPEVSKCLTKHQNVASRHFRYEGRKPEVLITSSPRSRQRSLIEARGSHDPCTYIC